MSAYHFQVRVIEAIIFAVLLAHDLEQTFLFVRLVRWRVEHVRERCIEHLN